MMLAARVWLACGAVVVTAAARSTRRPSALRTGCLDVGALCSQRGPAAVPLIDRASRRRTAA